MKPHYRPDIDGLRAIAVVAVLLFHGRLLGVHGGFIGVDVFFVLSGYLITSIILREIQAKQFSIIGFYERRVRRIFPALFLTIALTLLAGLVLLPPREFAGLGKSAAATTVFVSNVLFWRELGYFATPAEHKPLLHLWSLAVEEQFYIFFPLMLVCIRRFFDSRFRLWLTIFALASFGVSVYTTFRWPDATFYLAPARAWELLLGAILFTDIPAREMSSTLRNILAALGLMLIVTGVFVLTPETPFPGLAALLPTVGTALIIVAGARGTSVVGQFLSMRPLVFVGLISYSLYLLHWPMIVYAKQIAIVRLSALQMCAILLAATALAAMSWRFVERPFRSKQTIHRKPLFAFAAVSMTVTLAASLFIMRRNGLPERMKSVTFADDSAQAREYRLRWPCLGRDPSKGQDLCTMGDEKAAPTFILWGDSHALAAAPAVEQSALKGPTAGKLAVVQGCPPLLGIRVKGDASCLPYTDAVFSYVRQHQEIRTVILIARWGLYTAGRYKEELGRRFVLGDRAKHWSTDSNQQVFDAGVTGTVSQLLALGKRVVLVEPVPEIGYDLRSAFLIADRLGRDIDRVIAPTRSEYAARNRMFTDALQSVATLPGVEVVKLSDRLCGPTRCRIMDSKHALYMDDNHLSVYGALYVSSLFDEVFMKQRASF